MTFEGIQSKKDLPRDPQELLNFSWELFLAFHQLNEKYHQLQRRLFGRSSERMSGELPEQLKEVSPHATPSEPPATEQQPPESSIEVTSHKRRRSCHGRNAIPEEIITEHLVDIPEEEKKCTCGRDKTIIGQKSHIVVERLPARYTATRYVRPVYACSHCKHEVTVAEPVVATPIAKGLVGPMLVVFVLLSKYVYHLPLYRIQRLIFHESCIWFTRSTLVTWVKETCGLLERLHRCMLQAYRQSRIKYADETPLRVRLSEVEGSCSRGWMWVGVGNEGREVVFWYHQNRTGKAAQAFLKGSNEGDYLMSDDLASYDTAVHEYRLQPLLCMMHARRKFFEAFTAGYKADFARRALRAIRHLYRFERFADEKNFTVQQRGELRKTRSARVVAAWKEMLDAPGFDPLPGTLIGKAINYCRGSNWERLTRFLESGDLPIDNGITERALRALTIGRNNWLFAGSYKGATWMAILYSLCATCKLNGINTHEYLADVLMRISIRPSDADVTDLTPLQWLKSRNGGTLPPLAPQYPDN